jgi:hypothetical protein
MLMTGEGLSLGKVRKRDANIVPAINEMAVNRIDAIALTKSPSDPPSNRGRGREAARPLRSGVKAHSDRPRRTGSVSDERKEHGLAHRYLSSQGRLHAAADLGDGGTAR